MDKVIAIDPGVIVGVENKKELDAADAEDAEGMKMVEKQQTYEEIVVLLEQIINDRTVPKNIRKAAEDSKAILTSTDPAEVKISTTIGILDEITNDPNMPMYTRTLIWNAVSILEQKRREV